jgi:hypothetical protein
VEIIQTYLKNLDIYELNELRMLSEQYQEIEGDANITDSIFDQAPPPQASSNAQPSTSPLAVSSLPPSPQVQSIQQLTRTNSGEQITRTNSGTIKTATNPQKGLRSSGNLTSSTGGQSPASGSSPNSTPSSSPQPSPRASGSTGTTAQVAEIDVSRLKPMMIGLLQDEPEFRAEVKQVLQTIAQEDIEKRLDSLLAKEFPGSKVSPWTASDSLGAVYGWPEELSAKVVQHNSEVWIVPLLGIWTVDRAELSIHLRILQLYESVNRFSISQSQRPKVCIVCNSITEAANKMATRIGSKIILV